MSMHAEPKRLWVEALRSGEYTQGREYLASYPDRALAGSDTTYCCMGVACEVAMQHGVTLVTEQQVGYQSYNDEFGILPVKVADWLGADSLNPSLRASLPSEDYFSSWQPLSYFNDQACRTFAEIADMIEEQL